MLEVLTGTGLSAAAGLNAYIPMLAVGLLARYTDLINLPSAWNWLTNPWLLAILGALLLFELAADKIPGVDHINDTVQTLVRPAAGGLTFGAASGSETIRVDHPSEFFANNAWFGLIVGAVVAFGVHLAKAAVRVAITAVTLGFGNPVISTVEDGASVTLSLAAIIVPALVVVLLATGIGVLWLIWHLARRTLKARKAAGNVPADDYQIGYP